MTQGVGTAPVAGPPGSVLVVAAPAGLNSKWLRLRRPNANSGFPEFQAILSQVRGEGRYTFSAIMLMPAGAETVTIQFEQQTPSNSFLHLDLLPDNQVRIDDNETTKFGTFPRDQPFIVQVTLDTTSTPKAHFVLSGAGASGITDYTIQPSLQEFAHQFGAIRLWIGFPHIAETAAQAPSRICTATNEAIIRCRAGFMPGVTSASRDDYRQSIASDNKAASDSSFHCGSRRGGYGYGLAVVSCASRARTRLQRFASSEELWKWIDAHQTELGVGRPYLDRDPPHVAPIDGKE